MSYVHGREQREVRWEPSHRGEGTSTSAVCGVQKSYLHGREPREGRRVPLLRVRGTPIPFFTGFRIVVS